METATNHKKHFRKYLKPGELAQIRDSQISGKRKRDKSVSGVFLRRALEWSPISGTADASEIMNVEDFRGGGPSLCLNRKKIAAIKRTNWFLNPNFEIPTTDLTRQQPIIDALSSDVAANGVSLKS